MSVSRQLVEQLIKLANEMDEKGMLQEADDLTRTAQFMMENPQSDEFSDVNAWEEEESDPELEQFFGSKDDTSTHNPVDYGKRINEFSGRLEELADEATSVDEFKARAKSLADTEFEDIYFETDNIIQDALVDFLRRRPEHLKNQVREHAFSPQERDFTENLENAGVTIR